LSELSDAAILLLILLGGSAMGMLVRPFLSERHRSVETTDLIRLVVTMLVTFAALVLGLLTSSVKASFDTVDNDLRGVAIQLIQLDRSLRVYAAETVPARNLLRSYTAAKIATTWSGELSPPGNSYRKDSSRPPSDEEIEDTNLGQMLTEVETDLRDLQPQDPMHRRLSLTILNQFEQLMRVRWKVIEEAHNSISMPFYIVLTIWLVIVFASFGLSAPRNLLSYITIMLGGLSIASVIFVILDLDTPFSGLFMVSSQPMHDALNQLSQ
jgi:hypothetical protein